MQAPVQDVEAARIIVLLTAMAIVAFWRTAVQWLLILASTVIITTVGFGLIAIWQAVHHTVA